MNVLVEAVNAAPRQNVLTLLVALRARAIQAGLETVRRAQVTNISLILRFLCTISDPWQSSLLTFTAMRCFKLMQCVRIDISELRQTKWLCEEPFVKKRRKSQYISSETINENRLQNNLSIYLPRYKFQPQHSKTSIHFHTPFSPSLQRVM